MSPVEQDWSIWCTRTDEWDVCSALIRNGEGEMSLLSSKMWWIVTEKVEQGFLWRHSKRVRGKGNKLQRRKF